MGKVITFNTGKSQTRREAELPIVGSSKWICNEKRYLENLKKVSGVFKKLVTDEARQAVLPLIEEGLYGEYNIHMSARVGRSDSDVEFELIPGSDGRLYFAVYTDAVSAYRSNRSGYYNTDYVISMNYLLSAIFGDELCGGICINPYNDGGCMITRYRLNQLYASKKRKEAVS